MYLHKAAEVVAQVQQAQHSTVFKTTMEYLLLYNKCKKNAADKTRHTLRLRGNERYINLLITLRAERREKERCGGKHNNVQSHKLPKSEQW